MLSAAFKITLLCLITIFPKVIFSQETKKLNQSNYVIENDILYYDKESFNIDDYMRERCRLDLYYPTNQGNFATVVWFHGGGLKAGEKFIPVELLDQGLAIAAVNYRLFPVIKSPKYIEDAAASVAWVFNNIHNYGGDTNSIFVSGHSAGGYLTSMIGLDKNWLLKFNIDADRIAGLIPFSGHTITHFTVREERGIPREQPIIDELAPLYHIRNDSPPIILITGDRNLELLGRYEENAYLYRMLNVLGHYDVHLYELQGFDHIEMTKTAFSILLKHISSIRDRIYD